jgi:predicted DNA-binding protein with PD1-like motif
VQSFRGGVPLEVILVRLDAGEDLRASLARAAEELSLGAAVVLSAQGVLSRARLALGAGEVVIETPGPLRIVSLHGTLFAGDIDLTLALGRSGEPLAGAVREGCVVESAVECVLLRIGQLNPIRVPDATGVPRLHAGGRLDASGAPTIVMDRPVNLGAVALVPPHLIERHQALPIARAGDTLVVAMADVTHLLALEDLRLASGLRIRPVAVPPAELRAAIENVLKQMGSP